MKPSMRRRDRRVPILREAGMDGPAMLDRPIFHPRLPSRQAHVAGLEQEAEKSGILNRLRARERDWHRLDSGCCSGYVLKQNPTLQAKAAVPLLILILSEGSS
jgi:hypothetical protein